jgi:hypothetical protein
MGLADADINWEEIDVKEEYSNKPLPDGDYVCSLERATDEPDLVSKDGAKYSRVNLMFRIIEGEHSNKCVFHQPMYEHSLAIADQNKQKAVSIGCQFLKKLHTAGGCSGGITPEGLMTAGALKIKVKTRKGRTVGDVTYDDQNVITAVMPAGRSTESPF